MYGMVSTRVDLQSHAYFGRTLSSVARKPTENGVIGEIEGFIFRTFCYSKKVKHKTLEGRSPFYRTNTH